MWLLEVIRAINRSKTRIRQTLSVNRKDVFPKKETN